MRNMEMGISLKCTACGNDEFFAIGDEKTVSLHINISCSECGLITNTEQLTRDNTHLIDSKIDEIENNEYIIIGMMASYPSESKIKFEIFENNC